MEGKVSSLTEAKGMMWLPSNRFSPTSWYMRVVIPYGLRPEHGHPCPAVRCVADDRLIRSRHAFALVHMSDIRVFSGKRAPTQSRLHSPQRPSAVHLPKDLGPRLASMAVTAAHTPGETFGERQKR